MAAKKATTKKEPAAKKPSLDIKDEMYWADKKRFDWLESQDPELAKTFSPVVAMKWMSVVNSYNSYDVANAILNVNEFMNQNFWDFSKDPELCWRLLCACGEGTALNHGWVALAMAKKHLNSVDQIFANLHPHLNTEEIKMLRGKYDTDSFKRLLLDMAKTDAEIKPLMAEFKKLNG